MTKQLSLLNPRGAGRKAVVDAGIRHTHRPHIAKLTVLHLTVKVGKLAQSLKNKNILRALHRGILRARMQGLRVVHYTLEYDHVHLLVEARSNIELGKGMQSFGITFAKLINRYLGRVGSVYKTRYHFRKLTSPREVKNVISYIFKNCIKHKSSLTPLSLYNSLPRASYWRGGDTKWFQYIEKSLLLSRLKRELRLILPPPQSFLVKKWVG